jgi:hypothetical protein
MQLEKALRHAQPSEVSAAALELAWATRGSLLGNQPPDSRPAVALIAVSPRRVPRPPASPVR